MVAILIYVTYYIAANMNYWGIGTIFILNEVLSGTQQQTMVDNLFLKGEFISFIFL